MVNVIVPYQPNNDFIINCPNYSDHVICTCREIMWTEAIHWSQSAISMSNEDEDGEFDCLNEDPNYMLLVKQADMYRTGGHGLDKNSQKAGEYLTCSLFFLLVNFGFPYTASTKIRCLHSKPGSYFLRMRMYEPNLDVSNSQQIIRSSSTLPNSLAKITSNFASDEV